MRRSTATQVYMPVSLSKIMLFSILVHCSCTILHYNSVPLITTSIRVEMPTGTKCKFQSWNRLGNNVMQGYLIQLRKQDTTETYSNMMCFAHSTKNTLKFISDF